ncbi:MAG TPA: Gfo/Idh/MocA family oxidoreductase [Kofleriaceae bacterium]|nr:Gfo/Idh/MocA family oxidoreductase [Kofleriaceae bacterium]
MTAAQDSAQSRPAPGGESAPALAPRPRPRLGFLGVGWIGRHRMQAVREHGVAEVAAIADPSRERREAALAAAPGAIGCEHLGQLLELPLDGLVIATPSALHAEQCATALARGLAVFCQKPLGRGAEETRRVVDAARAADRLLAVDLSYRHTAAMQRIRELVRSGCLGRPFAIDLVFHNAYGPDAPWFYDRAAAGGGCVIDLGVHLVDLALWLLDFPAVAAATSRLYAGGEPLRPGDARVEDFAAAQLALEDGAVVRLCCSWHASAGRDAVIEASVFGTGGGAAMKNVGGSFYDFVAERFTGTRAEQLATAPDAWGPRAVIAWAEALAAGWRFDPAAEQLVAVARALDLIYQAHDRAHDLRVAGEVA